MWRCVVLWRSARTVGRDAVAVQVLAQDRHQGRRQGDAAHRLVAATLERAGVGVAQAVAVVLAGDAGQRPGEDELAPARGRELRVGAAELLGLAAPPRERPRRPVSRTTTEDHSRRCESGNDGLYE